MYVNFKAILAEAAPAKARKRFRVENFLKLAASQINYGNFIELKISTLLN